MSTYVTTNPDGGMVPVLGHLATIEAAAAEHGWLARGRVAAFRGEATRWYSRGDDLIMVEYGKTSQVTYAADGDGKVTGKDRVGQIVAMLAATS